jgi:hypothetical protein
MPILMLILVVIINISHSAAPWGSIKPVPTSKTPHPHAQAHPTLGARTTPNDNAKPSTLFTARKLGFRLFICVTTDIEIFVFFIFKI